MDKVSIIVAVYNIENYITRCIKSLLNQTYKNIEVLIVDDGSNDSSGNICDKLAMNNSNFIVYHKKNEGLSSARNYGIDRCTGKYITFVDGDDWVTSDFIETLYNNIVETNADLSIIGYTLLWDTGKEKKGNLYTGYKVYNKDEALHELFVQERIGCMAWQKMYNRRLFETIRFPEGKLFEDVAIMLQIFEKCNKVVWCGDTKYYYFQRSGSIVNSKFNINKLFLLESCNKMIQYSKSRGGKFNDETNAFFLKSAMMLLFQIYGSEKTKDTKKAKRVIREEIIKKKIYLWNNRYLPLRKKIILQMMIFNFIPDIFLYKVWKIWMNR